MKNSSWLPLLPFATLVATSVSAQKAPRLLIPGSDQQTQQQEECRTPGAIRRLAQLVKRCRAGSATTRTR
ncbi:hypothetical protein C3Y08_33640 [Burkholderia gladioli]|nr:hypothetical protein C3Y08_33640 [Burkholderia gladioli]